MGTSPGTVIGNTFRLGRLLSIYCMPSTALGIGIRQMDEMRTLPSRPPVSNREDGYKCDAITTACNKLGEPNKNRRTERREGDSRETSERKRGQKPVWEERRTPACRRGDKGHCR